MQRAARFLAIFLGLGAVAWAQATLLTGLVAGYGFDGTGADSSGNGYTLTLSGGTGYTTGLFGQALNPAGNVNHYATRTVDDSAFDFGTANFTVQIWVNYLATTNEQVLVEKFSGQTGPGWTLTKLTDNRLAFGIQYAPTPQVISGILTIALGSWHQAIIRRTGTTLDLYFDGALANSATISGATTADTTDPLLVGRRDAADGRGFITNGSLDELAVWSRALTDSEIATLYNGGAGVALSSIPEPAHHAAIGGLLAFAALVRRQRRGGRAVPRAGVA